MMLLMQRWLMMIIMLAPLHALAQTYLQGRVVGVIDGDTITILDASKKQHRIRLAQIDAPEFSMPFGRAAKKFLSNVISRKTVEIDTHGLDRYGRVLATVFIDKQNVNLLMVASGYAWAYRRYLSDLAYCRAEDSARKRKLGLWTEPQPIPPWRWRMQKRINPQSRPEPQRGSAMPCGIHARSP